MHVIAFTAGAPSAALQAGSADLARRLRGARVDFVSLAPEMGSAGRAALSALAGALNTEPVSTGAPRAALGAEGSAPHSRVTNACTSQRIQGDTGAGAACSAALAPMQEDQQSEEGGGQARARLIWLDPPVTGLEAWQQLEPLLEQLEASGWPIRAHQPDASPELPDTSAPALEQQAAWPDSASRARSRLAGSLRRACQRAEPAPGMERLLLEEGLAGAGPGTGTTSGAGRTPCSTPAQVHGNVNASTPLCVDRIPSFNSR